MATIPTNHISEDAVDRLIGEARQGRREALGLALQAQRNYLHDVAVGQLGSSLRGKADPSDVVQETLLKAQRDFSMFAGKTEKQLRAWLLAILKHSALEFARRYRSASRDIGREEAFEDGCIVPAAKGDGAHGNRSSFRNVVREERVALLLGALSSVRERDRNVVAWRHEEGCTFEEIGQRLGCSVAAAHEAWCRALRHLRSKLASLEDDSSIGG